MLSITKVDDNNFKLAGFGKEVTISKAKYEDVFYAVPPEAGKYMSSTYLYRLLVDDVCEDQAQRDVVVAMLKDAGNMDEALNKLQDQVKALQP